jgi:hypothetical protein
MQQEHCYIDLEAPYQQPIHQPYHQQLPRTHINFSPTQNFPSAPACAAGPDNTATIERLSSDNGRLAAMVIQLEATLTALRSTQHPAMAVAGSSSAIRSEVPDLDRLGRRIASLESRLQTRQEAVIATPYGQSEALLRAEADAEQWRSMAEALQRGLDKEPRGGRSRMVSRSPPRGSGEIARVSQPYQSRHALYYGPRIIRDGREPYMDSTTASRARVDDGNASRVSSFDRDAYVPMSVRRSASPQTPAKPEPARRGRLREEREGQPALVVVGAGASSHCRTRRGSGARAAALPN